MCCSSHTHGPCLSNSSPCLSLCILGARSELCVRSEEGPKGQTAARQLSRLSRRVFQLFRCRFNSGSMKRVKQGLVGWRDLVSKCLNHVGLFFFNVHLCPLQSGRQALVVSISALLRIWHQHSQLHGEYTSLCLPLCVWGITGITVALSKVQSVP